LKLEYISCFLKIDNLYKSVTLTLIRRRRWRACRRRRRWCRWSHFV